MQYNTLNFSLFKKLLLFQTLRLQGVITAFLCQAFDNILTNVSLRSSSCDELCRGKVPTGVFQFLLPLV